MAIDTLVCQSTISDSGSDISDEIASNWSDSSSDVTELEQDEFPTYFVERNGRLFHSHGSSPYPLPVDAAEQQRTNGQHFLLRWLVGSHYCGPVRRVLRDGTRAALDLGTGTGQWVLDMAREFPYVRFYGIDIVPIATRRPPDNVFFEMADVNAALRFRNSRFDLVHARSISMAVTNYPVLLGEVARVLRPGGLFLAGEWGRSAALIDGRDPRIHIPRTYAFYAAVHQALRLRNLHPAVLYLEDWLEQSDKFERVKTREYRMPVGDWPADEERRALGVQFKSVILLYAESMRVVLSEAGWGHTELTNLIQGYISEINRVRGMVCVYKMVYARRVRNV